MPEKLKIAVPELQKHQWKQGLMVLASLTLLTGCVLNFTTGIPVNMKGATVKYEVTPLGIIERYTSECVPKPEFWGGTAYYRKTQVLYTFTQAYATAGDVTISSGTSWTSCKLAGKK